MKKIFISKGNPIASIFKTKLLAICLVFIQCKSDIKDLPPKQDFSQHKVSTIQQFVDEVLESYPIPGLALAIVHEDSVYYAAAGIKNNKNELLTINTPIHAGAISETLLANAVLKLANSKRINLDDRVVDHLPYFTMGGDNYKKITVRNLLTHTSGIDHYNMMWDMPNFDPNAPEITTRSIATQHPKWSEPGTHVLRSPYSYDILAYLVSKVTKKPFEDYVRDEIFLPLGMNDTRFFKVKNVAMPFGITDWLKYSYKQNNIYPYNRENGGSGGLHASIKDMAIWMYEVINQDYNSQSLKTENEFFQSQFKTGDQSSVGYGWDINKNEKNNIYSKGSQYGGFSHQIIVIPSKRIGVVALSNISGDFNPSSIARDIASWLNNNKPLEVKVPISIAMTKELSRTGRIEDSFKIYHQLKESPLNKYDFSVRTLEQFGNNLLHRVNDKKNAIKAFEFCVDEYPNSSTAYLHLAEAHVLNKDVINSKKAIQKAKALSDDTGIRESFLAFLNEKIEVIEEKQL